MSARPLQDPSRAQDAGPLRPPRLAIFDTLDALLYPPKLNEDEEIWRNRYSFFLDRGYQLRPRYEPGWTPSWIGTDLDPCYCEDAVEQILPMVLDATRTKDDSIVCIKRIRKHPEEANIGRYLSSQQLLQNSNNHTVPIIDSFRDPELPDVDYIVMPVLRPYDDPEFGAVGEVVEFVTQILEGMEFMHSQLVAHGDLTSQNIMMDGTPIYPNGWHFVADNCSHSGVDLLPQPLPRIDHRTRYYIVDFGFSIRFLPGQSHIIDDYGGRDREAPELVPDIPRYDAFKLDVFTVGNVLYKDFYQKYLDLDFLKSLIDAMMTPEFQQRPTALVALHHWYRTKIQLDVSIARWRLRRRSESVGERVVLDTVDVARQGIHGLKRLFNGDDKKSWSKP